tara:strand:- start:148 stop:519 length:372 start_codon:yes stop_codon:yes gene_type:complete
MQVKVKKQKVMRKISLVLVAAMLLSTGGIFANDATKGGDEPSKSLSTQIKKLLNYNTFTTNEAGKTAQVLFLLNSEREIVVLNVEADDPTMDTFIKGRLNYQEVELGNYEIGKKYTVSVRVKA